MHKNIHYFTLSYKKLPSTLYIMLSVQLQSFEVPRCNGLGEDAFTKNILFDI